MVIFHKCRESYVGFFCEQKWAEPTLRDLHLGGLTFLKLYVCIHNKYEHTNEYTYYKYYLLEQIKYNHINIINIITIYYNILPNLEKLQVEEQ